MSIVAKCPECNHEFLYKGKAKRPRPTCPKCKEKFYIGAQNTQKEPKKTSSKKKKNSPQEGNSNGAPLTTRLSSDDLEKRLLMALEVNPNNPNLLRTAIDFYLKVMIKSDSMEDEIDMEALKRIGIIAESGD